MEELSKKTLADLREIAKGLNIKSVTKYKKNELVELINDNYNENNKIDNSAVNNEEYTMRESIKAEEQRQEKENIDNNGSRNRYINRNNDTENNKQGEKSEYKSYVIEKIKTILVISTIIIKI